MPSPVARVGVPPEAHDDELLHALLEIRLHPLDAGEFACGAREAVYQSTAYVGIGRAMPFVEAMDRMMSEEGVQLPLPSGGTVSREDRVSVGEAVQVAAFGEMMRGMWRSGHVNRWLAGNCFGDYYTRGGLDYRQRELITFCFLAAQGGCEPQLISHAAANLRIGNHREFLIDVVSQCLPYVGYPRSLNALRCIDEAAK